MKFFKYIAIASVALAFAACGPKDEPENDVNTTPPEEIVPDDQLISRTMVHTSEIFANPERGFYKHYDFLSSSASPLSVSALKAARVENNITLFYTGHYLTEFVKSDLSDKYLDLVTKNM
jgi:hypothetical protein